MSHYDNEREANQAATKSSYDYHRQAMIDEAINSTGGVYPGGNGCEYLQRLQPFSSVGRYVACRWRMAAGMVHVCTRTEFESRKAERQGKPDWKDAPEWANWLAQGSDGFWRNYRGRPKASDSLAEWVCGERFSSNGIRGEVIGNWQDTLEQRPEAETKANTRCDEVGAAMRDFEGLPTCIQDLVLKSIGAANANRKLKQVPALTVTERIATVKMAHERCGKSAAAKICGPEDYRNSKLLNELLSEAQAKPNMFEPWNFQDIQPRKTLFEVAKEAFADACNIACVGLYGAGAEAAKPSMFEPWACLEIPAGADWYDYERRQALKLPPVGIVCEVQAGRRWSKTHVVAHHIDGARAICCDDGFSCGELAYCAAIAFRPLDWDRNQPKVEPAQSPELSLRLANASNELQASAKLLEPESHLLSSITGVIGAIQAIREAV